MDLDLRTSSHRGFQESSGSLETSNRGVLANLYLEQHSLVVHLLLICWSGIVRAVIPLRLGSRCRIYLLGVVTDREV